MKAQMKAQPKLLLPSPVEAPLPVPLETLIDMLTYQRPAFGVGEAAFIERFIDTIPNVHSDGFGNRWVVTDPDSKTLFSAHTDTVHPKPNPDQRQKLFMSADGVISAQGKQQLGADDGAGCWILMNLIAAGVPGTYIFHRAEEQGGKGSSFIATTHGDHLEKFDRAIAFDRKGTNSIITEQSWCVCCSDSFALDLALQLGMRHVPDDTGTFTDTANYTEIIPECTNVSAGYAREHTFDESLDSLYLVQLARACLTVQWEKLTTARDPAAPAYTSRSAYSHGWHDYYDTGYSDKDDITLSPMAELIAENPEIIADLFIEYGFTYRELVAEIALAHGSTEPARKKRK